MKANDADYNNIRRSRTEIHAQESDLAPIEPSAEAITDEGKSGPTQHILLRGSLLNPGPAVQPGFVASLCGGREEPAKITPPPRAKRQAAGRRWPNGSAAPKTR